MVYKRYREESEAARMVWINSLLLSEHMNLVAWMTDADFANMNELCR